MCACRRDTRIYYTALGLLLHSDGPSRGPSMSIYTTGNRHCVNVIVVHSRYDNCSWSSMLCQRAQCILCDAVQPTYAAPKDSIFWGMADSARYGMQLRPTAVPHALRCDCSKLAGCLKTTLQHMYTLCTPLCFSLACQMTATPKKSW